MVLAANVKLTNREIWIVFIGLLVGNFLSALDSMVLITALPTIVGDLGGLSSISWVVTAYLLCSTTSAPIYGKLSDLYGRKRLYQFAICLFVVGSMLSGFSQSMGQLIAARCVQGLGAGGLMVLSMSIIGDIVSPRERGRYQGVMGSTMAVASLVGPIVGGFCVDHATWRLAFFINLPMGIIALAFTGAVLKLPKKIPVRHRFDVLGTALLASASICVLLAVSWGGDQYAWSSPVIIGLAIGAVASAGLLIPVERRAEEPVLPLRLFSSRVFNAVVLLALTFGGAMWVGWMAMPIFMQVVTGASASRAGLLTFPLLLTITISSIISGRAISRTGRYKAYPLAGCAIVGIGLVLYASMNASTNRYVASLYMVVLGAGTGFIMQNIVTIAQNAVDHRDLGIATATVNYFRSLGGSLGATIALAMLRTRLPHYVDRYVAADQQSLLDAKTLQGDPSSIRALPVEVRREVVDAFAHALRDAFLVGIPLIIAAVLFAVLIKEIPLRETVGDAADGSPETAGAHPSVAIAAEMV